VQAGRLDQFVTFQEKHVILHGHGEDEQKEFIWVDKFREWATADRLTEEQCRFTIHYRGGIRPDTHRIIWSGAYWTITSSLMQNRNTDLVLECDFSDLVEVTTLQSDVREYIEGVPLLRPQVVPPVYPTATEDERIATGGEEDMPTLITDVTNLIVFSPAGVRLSDMPDQSIKIWKTGQEATLTFDIILDVVPGMITIGMQLPPGFEAVPGIDFAGTYNYAQDDGDSIPGGIYFAPSLANVVSLYPNNFWQFPPFTQNRLYVYGQFRYVTAV
jgi:hypothetical protein